MSGAAKPRPTRPAASSAAGGSARAGTVHTTRPDDLRGEAPDELLQSWEFHRNVVVHAQYGPGEPPSPRRVQAAALDELACGAALVEHVNAGRWVAACAALVHGAVLDQVAAAMGLDVDEVVVGIGSWADRQLEHGLITLADRDGVAALIDGGGRR